MKKVFVIAVILVLVPSTVIKAEQTSETPTDEYQVCVEQYCHVFCPGGDMRLCFCISKNGQPLDAPLTDVLLKIECNQGDLLLLCPDESYENPAYISYDYCVQEPDCGNSYCWVFRLGGYCEEAKISLRMRNETEPFFKLWFPIKSPDINGDGMVNSCDESILIAAYGTNTVECDLNCDLMVDDSDLAILTKHLNHSCEEQVGTGNASWGAIKSMYQ